MLPVNLLCMSVFAGKALSSSRACLSQRKVFSLCGSFDQSIERTQDALHAHLRTAACEMLRRGFNRRLRSALSSKSKTKANGADRLARNSTAGSCDAGNRRGAICLWAGTKSAQRHLSCRLLADSSMSFKRFAPHAKKLLLGLIGISDKAAVKPRT